MNKQLSVWIGFDPRWAGALAVARDSVTKASPLLPVTGVVLDRVRRAGLYYRPTEWRTSEKGVKQLWDVISDKPMATEFAISRFLVPHLARTGWATFMDCDMQVRGDLLALMKRLDPEKALYCVKHDHRPTNDTKMDGQAQSAYPRKNWSSFMVFNCDHPANRALTIDMINESRGLFLHQFGWIEDEDLIGELPVEWNWLVGHSDPNVEPKNIHWTDGIPLMEGHENDAYAPDFIEALHDWAEGRRLS